MPPAAPGSAAGWFRGSGAPAGRRSWPSPAGSRECGRRRDFIRFFACEEDLSHEHPDARLPPAVEDGREPFFVVGAMAGG